MSDFISPGRIASLKSGIEAKTGGSYADLTEGVQALMDGYGQGGSAPVLEPLTVTENGTYTPGNGVDGFSKVVANVAGNGGDNVFQVISKTQELQPWDDMPETIRMNFLVESSLSCKITTDLTDKLLNLIISGVTPSIPTAGFSGGNKQTAIRTIDFGGQVVNTFWDETFRYCSNLVSINAILDFSEYTKWDRTFVNCDKLEEMRWLVNSVSGSGIPLETCSSLSDDSIISVANALKANTTETALTMTLNATQKARCNEILGTVSTVTDGDTSYDFFTMDEAGAVTLTEFITTVKGWTLA